MDSKKTLVRFFSNPSEWCDQKSKKVNKNHYCSLLPHLSFEAKNS
jgi:hypothetical protein